VSFGVKKPLIKGRKDKFNTLALFMKFILFCVLAVSLVAFLNSYFGISYYPVNGQTGQEDIEKNDSFSAIGQIASLVITVPDSDFNITEAFKVILTGEWNLSVRNGTVTNFNVDFAASPMDGRRPHIHQITDFNPYDNEQPIVLPEEESVMINGTADIKINGMVVWDRADISISISKGNTFYIDPDDEDTEGHFGDQQVHGIVTRMIS
jgi:hypothetical protein